MSVLGSPQTSYRPRLMSETGRRVQKVKLKARHAYVPEQTFPKYLTFEETLVVGFRGHGCSVKGSR
eukprot:689828-Amphidinium_carterae.1